MVSGLSCLSRRSFVELDQIMEVLVKVESFISLGRTTTSRKFESLTLCLSRYTSYLPLSGSNSYDNTANIYNVSKIVDAHGNFEPAAYEAYSTIFMPVTFALGYGISFAVMSCLPVHVYLYHWDDIRKAFMGTNKKDIHARLITRYRDVAWWWYAGMTVQCPLHLIILETNEMAQIVVIVLAIITQEVWHTEMPVWGVFMAFAMAAVYVIPVGTVYAVANLNSNVLTVLGEIISGYLLPGKPIVMLVFKASLPPRRLDSDGLTLVLH
jgi:hypothetical protein